MNLELRLRITRNVRACLAAAIAASCAASASAQGEAPAANGEATDRRVVVTPVAEDDQRAALAYWTPERRRAALALDLDTGGNGTPATVTETVTPAGGEEMTSMGHLFLLVNGREAHCSANAVTSLTRSVVATAAHCVQVAATEPPRRIERMVFEAHYRQGEWAGVFPVRNIYTVQGWRERAEGGFDFAFLSVARDRAGATVGDTVIPSQIQFAPPPLTGPFRLYGYPNDISGGELPQRCTGAVVASEVVAPGPRLREMHGCPNFAIGASGGPAMQVLDGDPKQTGTVRGYIASDSSVTFTYWEQAAHGAWDRAQHDQ